MQAILDFYLQDRKENVSEETFEVVKARCNTFQKELVELGLSSWQCLSFYWCKCVQEERKGREHPYCTYLMLEELHRFATWLTQQRMFNVNPIPLFWYGRKPSAPKRATPTHEEVCDLLQTAVEKSSTPIGFRNLVMVSLQACTGLRAMELRSLQVVDVHDDRIVVKGKFNLYRTLVVDPICNVILQRWLTEEREKLIPNRWDCEWLFPTHRAEQLTSKGLGKVFKEQLNTWMHPSHLRHFFATNMEFAGCPVDELKVLMGHSQRSNARQSYVTPSYEQILALKEKFQWGEG